METFTMDGRVTRQAGAAADYGRPLLAWALVGALAPAGAAALLALQDIDTLALAGQTTSYIALCLKWLVAIYFWVPFLVPTRLLCRTSFTRRHSLLYILVQAALGPLMTYLHMSSWYGVWSSIAPTGVFALRHPRSYYFVSRYVTETVFYYGLVIGLHAFRWHRRVQAEHLRRLHLENDLLIAQLQMLSVQLQPHFLFNTLNSISSLMRKDVDAADDMLVGLGAFLRQTLAVSTRSTISLEEELSLAKTYYELQRARCSNQASLILIIPSMTLGAKVPPMILQPLIENAFVHSRCASLSINCSAFVQESELHLSVENNGSRLPDPQVRPTEKIGLSNVRSRLSCMFGKEASLKIGNCGEDGVCVHMTMPFTSGEGAFL
jgi:two-component system, LytTR family, sensor kinase